MTGITNTQGIVAIDLQTGEAFTGGAITNSTIDSTPIGGATPAAGSFTTVSAATGVFTGDVRVSGKATIGQAVSAASIHADAIISAGTNVVAGANVLANGNISVGAGTVIVSGDAGNVTAAIFSSVTSGALVLTSVASGQGAQAGTLLNSPIAGNPSFYVPIRINGTIGFFPVWK